MKKSEYQFNRNARQKIQSLAREKQPTIFCGSNSNPIFELRKKYKK